MELTERIVRLERSNRRLKIGVAGLGVAALAVGIIGAAAPPPKIVTAERFVLVDADGRERAELSANEKSAALQFLNPNGSKALVLSAGSKDNGVVVADRDGQTRLGFIASNDGSATIAALRDGIPNENFIVTDRPGGTVMAIRDGHGNDRVDIGVTAKGPAVSILDANGIQRVGLGEAGAVASDDQGKIYWGSFKEGMTPEERIKIMNLLNSGFRPPN